MTELWVQMQEEGYIPSDSLKSQMANAFKKDGKPVPFQVPIQGINIKNCFFNNYVKVDIFIV